MRFSSWSSWQERRTHPAKLNTYGLQLHILREIFAIFLDVFTRDKAIYLGLETSWWCKRINILHILGALTTILLICLSWRLFKIGEIGPSHVSLNPVTHQPMEKRYVSTLSWIHENTSNILTGVSIDCWRAIVRPYANYLTWRSCSPLVVTKCILRFGVLKWAPVECNHWMPA